MLGAENQQVFLLFNDHIALINRAVRLNDLAYSNKKANKIPVGAVLSGVFAHIVGSPFR